MSTTDIISHFEHVRSHGENRWTARCPAHEDKSPSLAIRLTPDGRWLVHCFAGCDTASVLAAAGLTFSDLMPERLGDHFPRVHRQFTDSQILAVIGHEALRVALYACDRLAGKWPQNGDSERVIEAYEKIHSAMGYAHEHYE